MELLDLPNEVLSLILQYVAGGTLLRARCVCVRLNQVISDIVKKPVTWKERCLAEIPQEILLDICGSINLKHLTKGCVVCGLSHTSSQPRECCHDNRSHRLNPHSMEEAASAWLKIYMMWWQSRNVGHGKELKTWITSKAAITKVKISGDYFIGATKIGTVEIWNHLTGHCVASFLANYYNIVDLKLVPSEVCGINSLAKEHLSNLSTARIITAGIDRSVAVYDLNPEDLKNTLYLKNCSSSRIVGIGLWGQKVVSTSAEILYAGHKILNLSNGAVECYLGGYRAYPRCIDFWMNKVLSGTTQGHLLRWNLGKYPKPEENDVTPILDAEVVAEFHDMIISVIYRDNLILCIKSPGILYLSTNDGETFREINTMEILGGTAKLIALKGTIFALCTSGGHIYVYHVENYQCFKTLDLSSYQVCINTGAETIYDIDIGDDGDGPMFVIATSDAAVCVVRWIDFD